MLQLSLLKCKYFCYIEIYEKNNNTEDNRT